MCILLFIKLRSLFIALVNIQDSGVTQACTANGAANNLQAGILASVGHDEVCATGGGGPVLAQDCVTVS